MGAAAAGWSIAEAVEEDEEGEGAGAAEGEVVVAEEDEGGFAGNTPE